MPDQKWWAGKTVFVTGHTGFKGSWLCLWLQSMGATVVGYALDPPTAPNLFELAQVAAGMDSRIGDIGDFDPVRDAIADSRPDVVFHLAAQSLVRRSYVEPLETYRTNVMGTLHVLEATRQVASAGSVVNVTSDKCYENKEWVWGYREDEPKGGRDPYSNSKACADLVGTAYQHSFFTAPNGSGRAATLANARGGNVIGGGDWAPDRLIPDVMRAAIDGRPVLIRNPEGIRPWQHVLDCLSGYLLLAESVWNGRHLAGGWNFGPGEDDARSVRWMLERLDSLWEDGIKWEHDRAGHPHEALVLRLDSSKARIELGWRPRWGVERALRSTVEWYRTYAEGGDLRALTLDQIAEYEATAEAASTRATAE